MGKKTLQGLLIDYEFCTGCFTCQIACAQEYHRPVEQIGMNVFEVVTMKPDGTPYLNFLPFPTENCNLCIGRTSKGEAPSCVKHCMANVIQHGTINELTKKINKPRMVLWVPKASTRPRV
jgi:Fe-S-cluster-containing dehydrogenase component